MKSRIEKSCKIAILIMATCWISGASALSHDSIESDGKMPSDQDRANLVKEVNDGISRSLLFAQLASGALQRAHTAEKILSKSEMFLEYAAAFEKIVGAKPYANELLDKACSLERAAKGVSDFNTAMNKLNFLQFDAKGKVTGAQWLGPALVIASGAIDVMNASTPEEKAKEASKLIVRLTTTPFAEFVSKGDPIATTLIVESMVKVVSYFNDHPEKNGFAILINALYDHTDVPQKLTEWLWELRYHDSILVKQDKSLPDVNQEDGPFDMMPESMEEPIDNGRFHGLKPIKFL